MKRIKHFSFCLLFYCIPVLTTAQLTGTINIPTNYTTLALAITALNAQGVGAGGVTLNLEVGHPQTAPAGGYIIGGAGNILIGATNPSAANPVIIEGNSNIITASSSLTSGSLNDGIFKLIGADYISIRHFTLRENPSNIISTIASNNMTEWGIALLHVSVTDGANNNTIENNTIQLNRAYANTFGIYSNSRHSAAAVTGVQDVTNASGANSGNKVYSNAINNVGYGVVFVGSPTAAFMDNGNDIGGAAPATGNTFTAWGGIFTAISAYVGLANSENYAIILHQQINENASYNTITSAGVTGATFLFGGILKGYPSGGQPSGTFTSNINYNTITLSSANTAGNMFGIQSFGMTTALPSSTINIDHNNILNCILNGPTNSCSFNGIQNFSKCGELNITNNILKGTSISNASTLATYFGILNQANVTTTININNNQLGDASANAVSFSQATINYVFGIQNVGGTSTTTLNINQNIIQGFSLVSSAIFYGIYSSGLPGVAININNNQLGTASRDLVTYSAPNSGAVNVIYNTSGTATTNLSINGNDIRGIVHTVTATSSQHQYITSNTAVLTQQVNNNTFTNLNINTTGSVYFIYRNGNMANGASWTCNNNSIVTHFTKVASGGIVEFFASYGSSVNGSTMTETGNNFSNVTVTGTTQILCWENTDGLSPLNGPTKTITGNTFSNISSGSGGFYGFFLDRGAATNCSANTFTNISCPGVIWAIYSSTNNGQGTHTFSNNTISGLSSTGTGGDVIGISGGSFDIPTWNINNNVISGLSSTGASSVISGITVYGGAIVNVATNTINNLAGSGITSPVANGIFVNGGITVNVYKNKIYDLLQSGTISTTSPAVNGMLFSAGITVTAYNNFISDLRATGANLADAIRGISVTAAAANYTYNLYNNSLYMNATSSGANFGTTGIYHTTNATATTANLNLINNIIVNTSTANGTGITAAYRRSDATLTNYGSTSDYNLFYAGTPVANKLIFYDGTNSDLTLATYKTRVSPKDANSISSMPNFVSATDLHLTSLNCSIDNKGKPVAGITDDIDAETRSLTIPDIGADEFTAYNVGVLAGIVSTAVCSNKAVVNTGTLYTDGSCNLIAKVVPSGADPVTGLINTCVTRDATQLFFNGEPYVQRHYDLEPATSNQTTTSATITLYFTDAEFALYNSNNPVWPALPTIAGGGNADAKKANVKVTQFHGTPNGGLPSTPGNYYGLRVLLAPVSVLLNAGVWEVTVTVTGFSGFYVHTNIYNAPLPITINYFNGSKNNGDHLLNWKVTCISVPSATIELERSTDDRNYRTIYSIFATALRCQQPFNYTDDHPAKGINYYRLKMTDADGKVTYSTVISLINAFKGIDVMNIAPNPIVNNAFNLKVSAAATTQMEIVITDMQGRILQHQSVTLIAGFNSIPINVGKLAAGIYQLIGNTQDGKTKVLRFVIQ